MIPRLSSADAGAPPWLWLWMVLYLYGLPQLVQRFSNQTDSVVSMLKTTAQLQAFDPGYDGWRTVLFATAMLLEFTPALALAIGALTVGWPQLRVWYVERHYRLREPQSATPALAEISTFLHGHAPALDVKTNLLSSRTLAFVYPRGYGRATVALFAPVIKLWRGDRKAAEAVLLHEVMHHRRGDLFIIGAGSALEPLIRYLLVAFLGVNLIYALSLIARFNETPPAQLLWLLLASLAVFLNPVLILIAAIWTAELNADRYVWTRQQDSKGLQRALNLSATNNTLWQRVVFLVAHPPHALRRWMANQSGASSSLFLLLLLFPMSYLLRLITLHIAQMPSYLFIYGSNTAIIRAIFDNSLLYLADTAPIWLLMTGVLLLWPLIAPHWERLFARVQAESVPRNYRAHALCACAVGSIGIAGLMLR